MIKQLKKLLKIRTLGDNEVCNAEPCWCGRCDTHYANNFRKACEAEGIKFINISDKRTILHAGVKHYPDCQFPFNDQAVCNCDFKDKK